MGFYVHLSVVFACDYNDGVAELAKKHFGTIKNNKEAKLFLESMAQRSGYNLGQKGGLSMWGMIGNYTDAEEFVDVLRPFWTALLTEDYEGAPCSHAHVLVFTEGEDNGHANAFEIFLDDVDDTLVVKEHKLPFKWNQR